MSLWLIRVRHDIVWTAIVTIGFLLAVPHVLAYEVDATLTGVSVSGRITFAGKIPKAGRLPVHRDSAVCGETMPNEALQVDQASRGVSAVVVSLDGVAKGKALPGKVPVIVENRTCRFFPRANAALLGNQVEIRNSDPILHNTHIRNDTRYGDTLINVAQPVGAPAIHKSLTDTGLLDVRCDAHPFMRASIHVFEHPYFAVTDETGAYELTKVPPGEYRLRLWHERLGWREKVIQVSDQGPLILDWEVGLDD